jgi:hypothetical protein
MTGLYTAGWRDLWGNLKDAAIFVAASVKQWIKDLIPWKSKQIAITTINIGISAGTIQFVQDVLGAEAGDGVILDEQGDPVIDTGDMELTSDEMGVMIEPSHSSSDFCKEYAGNTYPFPEALEIPVFPAHPSCIHSCVIVAL